MAPGIVDRIKISLTQGWTRWILAYAGFYLLVTFILFSNFTGQVNLTPGNPSKTTITSPRTALIIDEAKTRQLQAAAASKVQKVYEENRNALNITQKGIGDFFAQISLVKNMKGLSALERQRKIQDLLDRRVQEKNVTGFDTIAMAGYLESATQHDVQSMREAATQVTRNLMAQAITDESLPQVIAEVPFRVKTLGLAEQADKTVEISVSTNLVANLSFNRAATQRNIDSARNEVVPVQRTIKQNEAIVREGEIITQQHIEILRQLGVQSEDNARWSTLAGSGLIVAIFMFLSTVFIRRYNRKVFKQDRLMMLLGLVFVIILAFAKAFVVLKIADRPEITNLMGLLIPVAAGSMLVAILLNQNLGYLFTIAMSFCVGLLTPGDPMTFVITAFVSGSVGVFWVTRLHHSGDLAKSALYISGVNVIIIVTMSLVRPGDLQNLLGMALVLGILNGFLSAILTIGLLPYLETLFSITSMIKLLELANPNQRILKRLLLEAPGTYHHSIMVGNLAETAAETVGAQPLVVRVGAYYHDIGKLKRPYFFVENQHGNENPHEKIAPSLSSLIITCHIKDGIELATENRLPQIIKDFIEQHHGTSLIKYFYSRALEEDKQGVVSEETFRYEGPKPQTKEAALVMLADSVEAAVRSLADPTPGKIEGTVRKIIKDKLYDGQLEESNLTFRDLNTIAERFSKVLAGIYHNRIEYPETIAREIEKRGDNLEDLDRKPADNP
ncbi:MAG: HD family phosphohydrolase [Solirubrobacterales bacterium]